MSANELMKCSSDHVVHNHWLLLLSQTQSILHYFFNILYIFLRENFRKTVKKQQQQQQEQQNKKENNEFMFFWHK